MVSSNSVARHERSRALLMIHLLLATMTFPICQGWTTVTLPVGRHHRLQNHQHPKQQQRPPPLILLSAVKQKRSSAAVPVAQKQEDVPANIAGSEFFGGNKEKEQFYDAEAEETAGLALLEEENDTKEDDTVTPRDTAQPLATVESSPKQETTTTSATAAGPFDRFASREAFTSDEVATVARQLQMALNQVLYDDAEDDDDNAMFLSYASTLQWTSPFAKGEAASNPLQALEQALPDYRRIDVAMTSGRVLSPNTLELTWEISVVWPTFWEPRVILMGSSIITLSDDHQQITQQRDQIFGDQEALVVDQLTPRFWDIYHIGMTPSAEQSPMCTIKKEGQFQIVEVPGRWMVTPTMVDTPEEGTQKCSANVLPFHAFNCIIKTVGPTQQRYVPTTPLEIQIQSSTTTNNPTLQWQVPLSIEFQSQLQWSSANPTPEEEAPATSTTSYTWQPPRRLAVMEFGGEGPQDALEIPAARKRLYDAVTQKNYAIQFNDQERPKFNFYKNAFKGCFTEEGLGMAVYEWRPSGSGQQIGMELEWSESK